MIKTFVVDDEPSVLKWLINYVDWPYYNYCLVGSAGGGQDALEFMRRNPVDLLITDVSMPDIDGLTLIARAKEHNPYLRIIIISAYSHFEYVKQAMKLGVENYLLKPIDHNELTETLQKTMENTESQLRGNTRDISVFRSNVLQKWVKNDILGNIFEEQAGIVDICLSGSRYRAAAIQIAATETDIDLPLRIFQICDELRQKLKSYFFIESDKLIVGILYDNEFDFDCKRPLNNLCQQLEEEARHTGGRIFATIGRDVNSYLDVHISYRDAIRYMPAIHMMKEPVLFCGDYPDFATANSLEKKEITMLINLLKENNFAGASQKAAVILNANPPVRQKKKVALSVCMNILETVDMGDHLRYTPQLLEVLNKYGVMHTNVELDNWINSLINTFSYNNVEFFNQLHSCVKKTVLLIRSQYGNKDLNLNGIAASLNVSANYLGQLFKAQTGQYFNDYLSDVRIEAARRILTGSDTKVGDIASRTGFASQGYMNRIFKKKYEMAPLEYRQFVSDQQGLDVLKLPHM